MNRISNHLMRLFLFSLFPSSGNPQLQFQGKIRMNTNWGNVLYISPIDRFGVIENRYDSTLILPDGSFQYIFHPKIPGTLLYKISIAPKMGNHLSVLEGPRDNILYLALDGSRRYTLTADADSLYFSAHIRASPVNEGLMKFRDLKRPFRNLVEVTEQKIRKNPDSAREYRKQIYPAWMDVVDTFREKVKDMVIRDTIPSLVLLGLYHTYLANFGRYDSVLFSEVLKKFEGSNIALVDNLRKELASAVANRIGKIFPGIPVEDSLSRIATIMEHTGELIVVDFWASWCTPCRQAIRTSMKEIYRTYLPEKITMIGFSVDRDREAWIKALRTDRPAWPQYRDKPGPSSIHEFFGIYGYPTYLVLDRNQRVIFETIADVELEFFLKKYFEDKAASK